MREANKKGEPFTLWSSDPCAALPERCSPSFPTGLSKSLSAIASKPLRDRSGVDRDRWCRNSPHSGDARYLAQRSRHSRSPARRKRSVAPRRSTRKRGRQEIARGPAGQSGNTRSAHPCRRALAWPAFHQHLADRFATTRAGSAAVDRRTPPGDRRSDQAEPLADPYCAPEPVLPTRWAGASIDYLERIRIANVRTDC